MRAKQLLNAGVRPSDVAPQVGPYDQSQLNQHFRRLVEYAPGATPNCDDRARAGHRTAFHTVLLLECVTCALFSKAT